VSCLVGCVPRAQGRGVATPTPVLERYRVSALSFAHRAISHEFDRVITERRPYPETTARPNPPQICKQRSFAGLLFRVAIAAHRRLAGVESQRSTRRYDGELLWEILTVRPLPSR
jgi:hypothetical protein